eukprot:813134-Pyramimonas_sp.AAC.1
MVEPGRGVGREQQLQRGEPESRADLSSSRRSYQAKGEKDSWWTPAHATTWWATSSSSAL